MTYEANVVDGVISLPDGIEIPPTARVWIVISDEPPTTKSSPRIRSPRLVNPDDAKHFELELVEDPDATL
ncbi:MAG: hypothetical protein O3A00_23845 [Planctomycetota bacterium]|nr:hypothetical protein [Planctomycetota bacterium]